MDKTLNNVESVALSKLSGLTKVPPTPGTHEVDFTIRVRGTITKGKDYEQRIVAKACPYKLLALVLSKQNAVTAESIAKLVVEADGILDAESAVVKDYADKAIKEIKGITWTTCSGKTTADLRMDVL